MTIILNGEPAEIEATTLEHALHELGYGDALVATALNREFVPAPLRGQTPIKANDRIEIIAPMQGG